MIREKLYNKTVDILVQAYFNDTLKHNDCAMCAVGNIIAGNGIRRELDWTKYNSKEVNNRQWQFVFIGGKHYPSEYKGNAKIAIDATGYTWQELSKIELAFERCEIGGSEENWMFNGLMSVIEVLDEIHQNTDDTITTQSKNKFNKQLNTTFEAWRCGGIL